MLVYPNFLEPLKLEVVWKNGCNFINGKIIVDLTVESYLIYICIALICLISAKMAAKNKVTNMNSPCRERMHTHAVKY